MVSHPHPEQHEKREHRGISPASMTLSWSTYLTYHGTHIRIRIGLVIRSFCGKNNHLNYIYPPIACVHIFCQHCILVRTHSPTHTYARIHTHAHTHAYKHPLMIHVLTYSYAHANTHKLSRAHKHNVIIKTHNCADFHPCKHTCQRVIFY